VQPSAREAYNNRKIAKVASGRLRLFPGSRNAEPGSRTASVSRTQVKSNRLPNTRAHDSIRHVHSANHRALMELHTFVPGGGLHRPAVGNLKPTCA
jgi:hypothetical protein